VPNVKTNAILPKGEENGLAPIAADLQANPRKLRAVLGIVDAKRGNIDYDTDEELVTVRFRRIELLLPIDLGAAEKLIRRSLEARSGQTTLDLDLEDEIRQAFDSMAEPDSPDDPDEPKGGKGTKGGKS
jgi:hypothetical protein